MVLRSDGAIQKLASICKRSRSGSTDGFHVLRQHLFRVCGNVPRKKRPIKFMSADSGHIGCRLPGKVTRRIPAAGQIEQDILLGDGLKGGKIWKRDRHAGKLRAGRMLFKQQGSAAP